MTSPSIAAPSIRATGLLLVVLLSACATPAPVPSSAKVEPRGPRVSYSLSYADGSRLKEEPGDIRIVRRSTTGKAVATQVFLNAAMLALGAGVAVNPFSKDRLRGAPIEGVADRERVRNPVSTDFVKALQAHVDERVALTPGLASRAFKYPIVVAGGHATLVYDSLADTEEEKFQLKTDLEVYKRRETAGLFSVQPLHRVSCADASTPALVLADWASQDDALLRQTLDRMLAGCAQRVVAQLDDMLKD